MEIYALVISILAFCFSIIQFIRDSSRQKKESTLNSYNQLQNDVFSTINTLPNDLSTIKYRDDNWETITTCLSRIENFSIGINTNIYSFRILNRLGGAFFIRQFEKLKPIIDIKRDKNISKGKHYDEFEKTVDRLSIYRNTENPIKKLMLLTQWYFMNLC